MKCICGYAHSPNNTAILKAHIEECLLTGPLSALPADPVVIWKNAEFHVVTEASEDDAVFDVGFVRPEASKRKLEALLKAQSLKLESAAEAVDTPEEVAAVVSEVIAEEDADGEVEAQEEPKPKRTRKKASPPSE